MSVIKDSSIDDFNILHRHTARGSFQDKVNPADNYYHYKVGKPFVVSTFYESLDYDIIQNDLRIEEEESKGHKYLRQKNITKWFAFMQIGIFTAAVASCVDIAITRFNYSKYVILRDLMEDHETDGGLAVLVMWLMLNIIPFTLGLLLVTYFEPMAAGSGIPLVKCYLNGIDVPRILSLKALVIKAVGLACSIIGGVASGKEGPMIHVGACIANLVAAGRINLCGWQWDLFTYFRDDNERRDLISAGAAAGVSAAFGAPVGGVIFSLEEGASFWNQTLTWRILFTSVISKLCVNLILSAYYGVPGDLEHPSLVNMGTVDFKYSIYELPIFAIIGILGGLSGAIWIIINSKIAEFRMRFLTQGWMRIVEGIIATALHAVVAYLMTYFVAICSESSSHSTYQLKAMCKHKGDHSFNVVGTMWLVTPQQSVNNLLHDDNETFDVISLATFTLAYFLMSCITFGLSSSNGIFVPTILTGASWGRLLSTIVIKLLPPNLQHLVDTRKYALIAGCAQLGGVTRMTICLTVLLMESCDNISFCLPIIITVFFAKWVGDYFTEGVYNVQIVFKACPFLPPEPPPLSQQISASHIMKSPVISVRGVENVGYIMEILEKTTHNGFPVISASVSGPISKSFESIDDRRVGRIRGLILRSQILFLLSHRWFLETTPEWRHLATMEAFRVENFDKPTLESLKITLLDHKYHLDMRPFMNTSPYTLLKSAALPKIFILFRALGLRHLPIVDESNEVVGMITRKDLAYFKVVTRFGNLYKCEFILV